MSANTITLRLDHTRSDLALRPNLHRGALLALMVAALAVALVVATDFLVGEVAASESTVAEQALEFPIRELPPEWRWVQESVPVEHMYSQPASRGIDWIKQPGSGHRSGY